jgi:hypothetical protein
MVVVPPLVVIMSRGASPVLTACVMSDVYMYVCGDDDMTYQIAFNPRYWDCKPDYEPETPQQLFADGRFYSLTGVYR